MAQPHPTGPNGGRHWASSPRPKARDNVRNTPCRNVVIYGHCRHEKDGCMYSHERPPAQSRAPDPSVKQRFNVDSPSFTPSELGPPAFGGRLATLSPQAANAAVFTPKLTETSKETADQSMNSSSEWSSNKSIPEFIPRNFQQAPSTVDFTNALSSADPFTSYDGASPFTGLSPQSAAAQANPYATDSTATNGAAAAFYQQQQAFQQPLQYHLYAPIGPHREHLPAFQRTVHDFFIPESLRQDLQRQNEAISQILPNLNLPAAIEHYHSLVPLDMVPNKGNTTYGYNTWTYKATSSKDGLTYVIRRLEGFRLTNEKAVYSKQAWKGVSSASVVRLHDCFTTRAFGDSSIVFVTDYHPLAKTLAEQHLPNQFSRRSPGGPMPESLLWSFAVQLAAAFHAIHSKGLAARTVIPSKVLVTSKNRLRLNCCGIMDVIKFEENIPLQTLQQDDFRQLGHLLLTLATQSNSVTLTAKTQDLLARSYSERFRGFLATLLEPTAESFVSDSAALMTSLSEHAFETLDSALHYDDTLTSFLNQELENGRLVRLLAKMGCINERPEYIETGSSWSETSERYYLKLFRDFVFHQVNSQGGPIVDFGHIIGCLNKLDAGSEEKIALTSRDEATVFVVSYKEIKRALESSFQELLQAHRRT